ncbi:TcdA/TcdB pore-forming domain-containing protein [Pseudomonas fluorescens]|uniref:TcdA/TcdB pore-forming domain-containing protein n=1 Tax=Pseudomonas fluorescens TaxID=294 RepID=UPI001A9D95B1|nr:TcdA/TcdB pore-forming domain-containing protein [Pseudomonas fluorescens]QTD34075.1 toxin [Pseudomonas fluorescens]
MQDAKNKDVDGGNANFVNLFKLSELEQVLLPYKKTRQYDAVIRYYFACIGLLDSPRLQHPLALFKQALGEFGHGRVRREVEPEPANIPDTELTPTLSQITDRVEHFESRLLNSIEQMKSPATQVPKVLHFVWLGGGIGEIQRDYINLWKQVLAGQGYKINLWYDSDAMLVHQTTRLIVEAAKAHAMQQGGVDSVTEYELGEAYVRRAIVLKEQIFAHINEAVANGVSADDARIQLLAKAYGQQDTDLKLLKERNLQSLQAVAGGDLQLRDLAGTSQPMQLQAIYDQEMRMRGNLAAGSDVVRLEVLVPEGGMYSDVDNLPPLLKVLGGVDISNLGRDAELGITQLLLDHNPHWMPGRQALRSRYKSYDHLIPQEHRAALESFAKSAPVLSQVFQAPSDLLAHSYMLRALAEFGSVTNAYLMAHPGAPMLQSVQECLRFNFAVIDSVAMVGRAKGVAPDDHGAMQKLAVVEIERRLGPLNALSSVREMEMYTLADAIAGYHRDGIRPEKEVTIFLTGPGAMRRGMQDYERAHFTPRDDDTLNAELSIAPLGTVNRSSEEEQDHSWKENSENLVQWVKDEKQRWHDGQYKTRYTGNIDELLKHSTVEFELGWPLVEGRHVLNTELLQRMADHLGEPFTKAMMSGHDGPVVFADRLPLSFDDRQAILHQDTRLRPPAFPKSPIAESIALDELLIGLGAGSWQLAQLTPLQRLKIGALLGADSLDAQSFAALNGALENLINSVSERGTSGRYAVIEQHLYQRRAPEFMAGMSSVGDELPAHPATALGLKKNALANTATLFDWGRQVAQIQRLATQEHREQVQERLEQVLSQFEAGTVKMVPQDLLMHGPGDTAAGRCFPLALAMGAALTQGEGATRQLRERFFLAVLEPEHPDSKAFLAALEEMRGVNAADVGTALGRGDLDRMVATLEESVGPRTLMLNSDNHSMLVARTVHGSTVIYHFYDPNFGLFQFDSPVTFRMALGQFFKQPRIARHYAVYGKPGRPQFDLIDVHGEKVADLNLSNGSKVSQLLRDDPLPGRPFRSVRQRMNSAHGRTLMENSRLGSALLSSDNDWWGEEIADMTARLQEGHDSVTPLVPLFDSLQVTPEGSYRVGMIDPQTGELVATVVSRDDRLLRIKNYLTDLFSSLGRKRSVGDAVDPTEAAAVHTLNAGFAVQALMNALRGREGEDRTLTTAVQWHAYVNYAQLVHGNVVDVAGLIGLVQAALRDEKLIARTTAKVVGEALEPLTGRSLGTVAGHLGNEGVGAVLGLANVGFDIYQLATARNDVEIATYATQLTFDASSLALTGAGLGAAFAGAGTAAAVLGGAGVILGGLAVGVTALAQSFATIAEEAKAVGLFFAELEQAHHGDGFHYSGEQGAWLPRPSLIINGLDLSTGKLLLDSSRLYPLHDHFGVPEFEVDYPRAIHLSKELGYPAEMKFSPSAEQAIVLPCTPLTCYRYEYQILPFASQRHDKGFDIARRLEKKKADGQWLFLFSFYSFPSHYIVHRMYPDYRPTEIRVTLDAQARKLVVPVIPEPWREQISYRIQGGGGTCTLVLNCGVNVGLTSVGKQKDRWIIVAPWAVEKDIVFGSDGQFSVKGCEFKVTADVAPEISLLIENGRLFQITGDKRHELDLLQEQAPKGLDDQVLQDHLQALARAHRLVLRYTPIHDYLIPFENTKAPRYTNGWYDAVEDRILYIRNDEVFDDEGLLSVVVGGSAFFHEPSGYDICQVDAGTGLLSYRFRLMFRRTGVSTIRSVEADGQGVVHVVQEYAYEDGTLERLNYLIHEGELWLSSVTRGLEPAFEALLNDGTPLPAWTSVLGDWVSLKPVDADKGYATVDWQFAAYVSLCWKIEDNARDMAWIRTRDNLIVRPVPRRHHARAWPDSIQNLNELMLLTLADDSDVFVIYDRQFQSLCRVQRTVTLGQIQWSHRWVQPERLKQVTAEHNGYQARTEDGLSFEIGTDGEVRFAGLTESWLKGRKQWWLALDAIARQYAVEQFPIVGIANAAGDARLHAWYVDNRLLLCDAQPTQLRLLGMTPDNQSAWLFEPESGEIWRQAFIDPQQLQSAFGEGTQLLQSRMLPKPERQWTAWRFADVRVDGAGLAGTTREGVVLQLEHQEQPQIIGVQHDWLATHGEHLIGDLQALLANAAHRPFISIASHDASVQWYIADSARLIQIPAVDLPEDYELLGTRKYADVLLHEPRERVVQGYPSMRQIKPLDYVQRTGDVLVLEGRVDAYDLLPVIPDDVRTLVLRVGRGSMKWHLSEALMRKLDSLVVDCRYPLGGRPLVMSRLILTLSDPQKLEIGMVDDHLVVIDPDSEHCVLVRNADAQDPALHGDVMLEVKGLRPCQVSTLVRWLKARKEGAEGMTLKALIDQADAKKTVESAG